MTLGSKVRLFVESLGAHTWLAAWESSCLWAHRYRDRRGRVVFKPRSKASLGPASHCQQGASSYSLPKVVLEFYSTDSSTVRMQGRGCTPSWSILCSSHTRETHAWEAKTTQTSWDVRKRTCPSDPKENGEWAVHVKSNTQAHPHTTHHTHAYIHTYIQHTYTHHTFKYTHCIYCTYGHTTYHNTHN